jgi:ABC-type glycerol-3-phosphate transport system substrate-binding protein
MKQTMKIRFLMAGLLVVLAVVLYSCGGGGGYGGGGGGGGTAVPGMFTLTSPGDLATSATITPTLTWTPATNVTDYRVQVDTTVAFNALIINKTVNATTYSYTVLPADNLQLGILYHWRVIAENAYGQATAGPFSFTP